MNETVLLDAELKPNPPMKPACLFFALVILTATNFAFALGFVLRGAWPIAPFMGADIGFLAWAFRTSVVAARQREWITLTPASLRIRRVPSRGKAEEIALNPYWVRAAWTTRRSRGASLFCRAMAGVSGLEAFLHRQTGFLLRGR